MTNTIDNRTLAELAGLGGAIPSDKSSRLERRCYELATLPIGQLDPEGLRLLIGQGIGLSFLVPRALKVLNDDPLACGMHYPGDLLASVLRAPSEFFLKNPVSREAAKVAFAKAKKAMMGLDEIDRRYAAESLDEAWSRFNQHL